MNNAVLTFGPALVVVLVRLAGAAVVRWGELGRGRAVLIAAVRAVAQLALVSRVINAVLRSTPLTGLFVLPMFSIAASRSWAARARRRCPSPRSHSSSARSAPSCPAVCPRLASISSRASAVGSPSSGIARKPCG